MPAFRWHLGQDFKNEFDQPLYQHVANITNVALNFDDKITAGAVRNVLKRQGVAKVWVKNQSIATPAVLQKNPQDVLVLCEMRTVKCHSKYFADRR